MSLVWFVGCGARLPERSEFANEVVTELPEVPGAADRYSLPELDTKSGETQETKELSK